MESGTEDFQVEFKPHVAVEKLKGFELYEEYSQRDIVETIQGRRDAYVKADQQAREELEAGVEIEVENFQIWLELAKKLPPSIAYYYSISLKSLLLGLPLGVTIARLFDIVLEDLEGSPRT